MAKRRGKKQVELQGQVLVNYHPNDDSIRITSNDKDLTKLKSGFQVALRKGTAEETALRNLLIEKGVIDTQPQTYLPSMLDGTKTISEKWDQIFIGESSSGPITWDVHPKAHFVMTGYAGSGKSVMGRTIINHCIVHSEKWEVYAVDFKRVELAQYAEFQDTVKTIVDNPKDLYEMLLHIQQEKNARYELLVKNELGHYQGLSYVEGSGPLKAIMVYIDGAHLALAKQGLKSDEGKAYDEFVDKSLNIIKELLFFGREVDIHIVASIQSLAGQPLGLHALKLFNIKLAVGRIDAQPSIMLFGDKEAMHIPLHPIGRGMVQLDGQNYHVQTPFVPSDWIYNWVLEQEGRIENALYHKLLARKID